MVRSDEGRNENRDELIELECQRFLSETDKAILVLIDGKKVWLPLSQIEYDGAGKCVTMPIWLAEKKELI